MTLTDTTSGIIARTAILAEKARIVRLWNSGLLTDREYRAEIKKLDRTLKYGK